MMVQTNSITTGDALTILRSMEAESCDMCVTSPPYYGLRNYGEPGQIGLEETPDAYVEKLVEIFREVKRVLKPEGTLWLNLGDSYAGSNGNGTRQSKWRAADTYASETDYSLRKMSGRKDVGCKPKDLIGIPWMVAFALRADGWYLRQDIIWQKTNCMPESVRDRCTKSHEHLFLLAKSPRYFFDAEAISEPITGSSTRRYLQKVESTAAAPRFGGNKYKDNNDGDHRKSGAAYDPKPRRNKRDVWAIATGGYKGAHFAVFPPALVRPCILAGSKPGGIVLDPFIGSGTTAVVALEEGRQYIGIDINANYAALAVERIEAVASAAQKGAHT